MWETRSNPGVSRVSRSQPDPSDVFPVFSVPSSTPTRFFGVEGERTPSRGPVQKDDFYVSEVFGSG